MATLEHEDVGKTVVDVEGERLGVVTEVEENTAYVDPEPGLGEAVLSAFGWTDANEDDYTLHGDAVDTVTEDELRVNADL